MIIILAAGEPQRLRQPAAGFEFPRSELLQLRKGVRREKIGQNRPLHVGNHRLQRFFADLGKVPRLVHHSARWPPIPSAQVLQTFFERIAFHSRQKPPASRALESVYRIACQPPPDLGLRIVDITSTRKEPQMDADYIDPRIKTPAGFDLPVGVDE